MEPLNSDAMSGKETVKANPKQTSTGPVNEDEKYTLTATNACGGTVTKTATLHVVGSIDPPPATTLASLFYPTAYPTKHHPKVGLVASEKMTLGNAATEFKSYELFQGKASLVVVGHADVRGPEKYNQALSKRRAALVKDYLVSKGVSADKIQTRAEGKDQQIDLKAVEALEDKNSAKPAPWMTKHQKATWLAYNRRVDVILEPSGQESTKIYPVESADARILWQRPMPRLKQVEHASQFSSSMIQEASLGQIGK
jgi:hypothetical protein